LRLGSLVGRPRRWGCTVEASEGCMTGVELIGDVVEVKSRRFEGCGEDLGGS
jgi:hypothetical protein